MQTKCQTYRNGWSVLLDKERIMYCVILRDASGEVNDKMRCDDYRNALDYYRSFKAIARNA